MTHLCETPPIIIRRHARAKRMTLRLSPAGNELRVTIPKRVSDKRALAFVDQHRDWIAQQQTNTAPTHRFIPGSWFPIFGHDCLLQHVPKQRGAIYDESTFTLSIGGEEAHFARRVTDWIRTQAKQRFSHIAMDAGRVIDERPTAITIRDTSSRWGSCSKAGRINLSWRLALAPATVARYVIVHEVAHLKHFDHSPAFWSCVQLLDPDYDTAKRWLQQHGSELHRYS